MSAKTYGFTGTLFLQLYLYNYIPSWLFLQGFWYLIQFVIFSFRRMRKTILWQRTIFIENIFFQSLTHLSKQHGSLSLIQNSISSFSPLSKINFFFSDKWMFTLLHLLYHWAALFKHISYTGCNVFVNEWPTFPRLSLFCWQTVDKLAAKLNRILGYICLYLTLPSEVVCSCCEFFLIRLIFWWTMMSSS